MNLNPKFNQPNRRGTDPYARWCGREGAARLLPIPMLAGNSPFPKLAADQLKVRGRRDAG